MSSLLFLLTLMAYHRAVAAMDREGCSKGRSTHHYQPLVVSRHFSLRV